MKLQKWLFLVLLALLVIIPSAYGKDVKMLMHKFLDDMITLKPYIVSEKKMNDPANAEKIKTTLHSLTLAVKEAKHESKLNNMNFKISRKALENHVAETEQAFLHGNKNYARWMLQSTLSMCMSCHTQLPAASLKFKDLKSTADFESPYEQAEFLFATRQFDKAHGVYNKAILNYPKNKINVLALENSLERQVAYYSRILRNPAKGEKYLGTVLEKNKDLPGYIKKNVTAWKALFHEWSQEKTPNMATISEENLKKYVIKSLKPELWDKMIEADNPRVMTYLKISGLLYEYLEHHPKTKLMPEILFWLAKCDRALNNNFFYSLADLYLKECIFNYPKTEIAKSCYKDLEDATVAGYSGSSGINVPPDVQSELDKMKMLIDQ